MSAPVETEFFFPGIHQQFGFFMPDQPAWTALDGLKGFIRDAISPNLPDFVRTGLPLLKHAALLDGQWHEDGFEVVCGTQTRGKFQVMAQGKLRPDAVLLCAGSVFAGRDVELGEGVVVEAGALVKGPTIIGRYTEIRQGAYIRGDCLTGEKCVVGHTTEVKHSIFLDNAKAGHFAYVGDSILGRDVNMGAGTKLANLRFGPGNVFISVEGSRVDTGRRKIGAIFGDGVQTGCNSVTNPGSIVGPGSLIAPNTTVAPGVYGAKSIIR